MGGGERPDGDVTATKLRPPSVPAGVVRRSRLHRVLTDAVGRHRLVLVSAPAGSGKSTLLAAWAEHSGTPAAWLQLEEADGDPARFWAHVVAALSRVRPDLADAVEPLATAAAREGGPIVTGLVNAVDGGDPLVLVLDDYHLIGVSRVHEDLDRLLALAPEELTVVLATRIDPPLRTGRLRAGHQMSEIRAADLCFRPDEAEGLLGGPGSAVDTATVSLLCERTEGWAAGLVLAGLSLASAEDTAAFIDSFRGDDRLVVDYLSDELLTSLPESDRERMLLTSVLDEMSGPLVDAVSGGGDGGAWLRRMAGSNQLVIALDRTGTWYRYHHLLRDLLRVEAGLLVPERVGAAHLAAAHWHHAHGDLHTAVEHLLAGGALDTAADVIAENATRLLNGGQIQTVLDQLDRLGEVGERHGGAAIVRGWISLVTGRFDNAARWQGRAAELDDGTDLGLITALGIMIHLTEGDVGSALAVARTAPPPTESTQAMTLGVVHLWAGDLDRARTRLAVAEDMAAGEPSDFVAAATPSFLAAGELEAGDLDAAARHADRAIAFAEDHGVANAAHLAPAHGVVAVTATDPDAATGSAHRAVELARRSPQNLLLAFTLTCAGDVLCGHDDQDGHALLTEARGVVDRCPDPGIVRRHLARVESRHGVAGPSPSVEALVEDLTDRELAVLRHLPGHRSQREIADELFVSLNTVKTHCRAVYRKLGVGDRRAAVQAARDHGLL